MAFLKKLSKIDDKTKYGVYGWIRKAEQELQLRHIPLMISSICILYYHEDDMFDIVSKHIKLSNDRKVITKLSGMVGADNTNYGTIAVSSNTNNIHRWDFKIREMAGNMLIGITDSTAMEPNTSIVHNTGKKCYRDNSYALWINSGVVYNGTKGWDMSDSYGVANLKKISIILNLQTSILSYLYNDRVKIKKIQNIQKRDGIKLKMFVILRSKDDCIELVNFTNKYL